MEIPTGDRQARATVPVPRCPARRCHSGTSVVC
jgi:hypothetical protein